MTRKTRPKTAANHLKKFNERYVAGADNPPVLLVVTGGKLSYTRDDGVHVVACGNLGA